MSKFAEVAVLSSMLPKFASLAFVMEAGRNWLPKRPGRPAPRSTINPIALVALADLKRDAGQEGEAKLLLEAAYIAFDAACGRRAGGAA